MFLPLTRLLFTSAPPTKPRLNAPPDHLQQQTWKYLCECGYGWRKDETDAVFRDGAWCAPLVECPGCHTWIDGRQVTGT